MNWRFWDKIGHDDCRSIEPLLSLYSDGMASPAERRRVEAHLPDCPQCQQTLHWMQATHEVIAQRPALTPPVDLRARIARAIADAEAAKSPATKEPARPVRRPLVLRPAFAYGLSLAVFAAIAGDIAWQSVPPAGTPIAVKPVVTVPARPQVADKSVPPAVSSAVTHTMSHVTAAIRSASSVLPSTVLPPTVHMPLLTVHRRKTILLEQMAHADTSAPFLEPATASVQLSRHLTPLTHKPTVQITRMAVQPAAHPAFSPPVIMPPHQNDQQVASAAVPPREEIHAPTVTTPEAIQIKVGPPTVTHDANQVAEHPLSLREELSHAAEHMQTVAYTQRSKAVNAANAAANIAVASSDRSGTVPLTYGDIR